MGEPTPAAKDWSSWRLGQRGYARASVDEIELATVKTRSLVGVGVNAKEAVWGLGDVISSAVLSCGYAGGADVTIGNMGLVVFDVASGASAAIIGADGSAAPVESLNSDIPVYPVYPGQSYRVWFNAALGYTGNVGQLGNAWARALNDVAPLNIFIHGIDKS